VPTVKSAKRYKQNTKTVSIQKNATVNKQDKNIYGRKKQNKRSTRSKGLLNPGKYIGKLI
jgi:hypothetical protein